MLAPTVTWDAGMIGSNGAGAKSKHSRCGGSDDSSATRANVQTLTSDATAIATLRAFNVLSFGPLGGLTPVSDTKDLAGNVLGERDNRIRSEPGSSSHISYFQNNRSVSRQYHQDC